MHGSYISLAVMAVGAAAAPSMPKSDMSSDPFSSFPFMSDTTAAVEDDDGMDNPIPAYMEAMQIAQSAQSGNFNSAPASTQSFQQPAQQAQQPTPTFQAPQQQQQHEQEPAPTFQAPQADPAPTFQAPQADPAPASSEAPEQHATPIFKTSEAVPPQPTQAPVIKPEVVQKPHEHHSHSIPAAITNIAPAPLSDPVPPMQMPASSSESDDMPMISEAPMVPQMSQIPEMSELPETYSSSFSTEAVFTIAPIPKAHSAMSSMTHSIMQTPMAKPEPKASSTHSVMMPVLSQPMPISTHSVMMQPTPTHQLIVTMSTKARPTHSVMIHEQHMASSKASASSSATPSGSATPSASAEPANPLGPLGGMLDNVPVLGGLLGRIGL